MLADMPDLLLGWALSALGTVLKVVIALLLLRASYELILSGLKSLFGRRAKKPRRSHKRKR